MSELFCFGRMRDVEWEGAVSVGTFNGWEVCVCVCVFVSGLPSMRGLTLWEFALSCVANCAVCYSFTHTRTGRFQHRGVCADRVVVTQTDYWATFKLRPRGWMWSEPREGRHEAKRRIKSGWKRFSLAGKSSSGRYDNGHTNMNTLHHASSQSSPDLMPKNVCRQLSPVLGVMFPQFSVF